MPPPFPANLSRNLPYLPIRFLLHWEQNPDPVAGISKITALKRSSAVVEYRQGGDPLTRKGPGRTNYDPFTAERGVTQDKDFITWADYVQKLDNGHPTTSLKNLRRDLTVTLLTEDGQAAMRWIFHRCWPSEFQASADLDASATTVLIEHMIIQNEGWEIDPTVTEQPEI
jgi:phage tail-like protein